MADEDLADLSWAFAQTIGDELERSDQDYIKLSLFGSGPQYKVYRRARVMIARYVRRAIEIDRKARPWLDRGGQTDAG